MKAECTWGDGPDVLVVLGGTPIMSYEHPINVSKSYEGNKVPLNKIPRDDEKLHWCPYGFIRQGSFDLTAEEALELAHQLEMAAFKAKELDFMASNL